MEKVAIKYASLLAQVKSTQVREGRQVLHAKLTVALLRAHLHMQARQAAQQHGFLFALCASQARLAAASQMLQTAESELRQERANAQAAATTAHAQAAKLQRANNRLQRTNNGLQAAQLTLEQQLTRAQQGEQTQIEQQQHLQQQLLACQDRVADLEAQMQRDHTDACVQLQAKQSLISQLLEKYGVCKTDMARLTAEQQEATTNTTLQLQGKQAEIDQLKQQQQALEARPAAVTSHPQQAEPDACDQLQGQESKSSQKRKKKKGKKSDSVGVCGQAVDDDTSVAELRKLLEQARQQTRSLQLDSHRRLIKPSGIPHMDLDKTWQLGKLLGKGSNASVVEATTLQYPDVVLKKGRLDLIKAEADKLWQLSHPNIARAYAVLHSRELDSKRSPVAYMALERLGPSLQDRKDTPER
ncbi:hypothetical protein ABBQ38_007836 [Trebouxia sp. C0009 RCD-2024]